MSGQAEELDIGVKPGDVLAGKYQVERILGVGGMGVVVVAHHIQLDERVALKFLLPSALGNPEAVSRFAREARAAVKIKSEHVASVRDVGELPSGAPYMVMEYLEGDDLSAWLKERGPLPVEQALDFVLQACVAVADAHALGIVHRDLKPANLFCTRRSDGQLSIKVLDFGISKMTDTLAGSVTRTSSMMGSPLYMSPELMISAKDVDAQADIWALGVILFELLTGRPSFLADTITELAILVTNQPAPAVRTLRPDAPGGLEAIILKCLEKDRRQRYRNVAELAVALLPFAPARAASSVERISGIIGTAGLSAGETAATEPRPPMSPGGPTAGAIPTTGAMRPGSVGATVDPVANTVASVRPPGQRRGFPVVAIGAGVLLLCCGIGFAVVHHEGAAAAGGGVSEIAAPVTVSSAAPLPAPLPAPPPPVVAAAAAAAFIGTWDLAGTATISHCSDGSASSTTQTLRQVTLTEGETSRGLISTGCACTFPLVLSASPPATAVLAMMQNCTFTQCNVPYNQNITKYTWTVGPNGTLQVVEAGTSITGTGASMVTCDLTRMETATRVDASIADCGCGDD